MRKIHTILALSAILCTQQVIAAEPTGMMMSPEDGSCKMIAKACLSAGFIRETPGKQLWLDCMKPILLGQKVSSVNIDSTTAQTCRSSKIEELKKDLQDFQAATPTQ